MELHKWISDNWTKLSKGSLVWSELTKNLFVSGTCEYCDNNGQCDIQDFVFRSPDYESPNEFSCFHFTDSV